MRCWSIRSALACDLTSLLSVRLKSEFSPSGFLHVVAGCGAAVLRSWGAAGAGFAGFWCTGQAGQGRVDVPEIPADPGGGEPASGGGAFPGLAQILGQRPGQPELGMRGDDQPGPAVRCLRGAGLRAGPAQDLLEQPERVLDIETAQERLPPVGNLGWRGASDRAPQPDRLGVAVTGQVIDLQADQGAVNDGQLTVVIQPAGAVSEPGMQPVPAAGPRRAITSGVRAGDVLRRRPGLR